MKENQKNSTSNQRQQEEGRRDQGKSPNEPKQKGSSEKNPDRNNDREGEGTKMPGRETRTPVAGNKEKPGK
jgi:hypothetical protein